MATGARPPSSPPCATTGSPRRCSSIARWMGPCCWPMCRKSSPRELSCGDRVLCDNPSPHKASGVREGIEDWGADLLYLPAYRADLNPSNWPLPNAKHSCGNPPNATSPICGAPPRKPWTPSRRRVSRRASARRRLAGGISCLSLLHSHPRSKAAGNERDGLCMALIFCERRSRAATAACRWSRPIRAAGATSLFSPGPRSSCGLP